MAITRTNFVTSTNKDLLKKGTLRKLHDDTVRKYETEYKTMYNDHTTDLMIIRDEQMAGFYRSQEIAEGQNIPIQAPVEGEQKEYTQRQFASGFRMTHKFKTFNQYSRSECITESCISAYITSAVCARPADSAMFSILTSVASHAPRLICVAEITNIFLLTANALRSSAICLIFI